MSLLTLTLIVIVAGPLWVFREHLVAWWRGQTYLEYLDSKIAALQTKESHPIQKQTHKWGAWVGFIMGAVSLFMADPVSPLYWATLGIGIMGFFGCGWLLLHQRI